MKSETALILATTLNDSAVAVRALNEANLDARSCSSLEELCCGMKTGCGCVVIAEECLTIEGMEQLDSALRSQEAWSDLPIILLTSADHNPQTEIFSRRGHISLLERPFSRQTLLRAVEVALRARRKQYEISDLLSELKKSKDAADHANLTKTHFLANMSHEIRTPIGAIIGFSDLLKHPGTPDAERARFTEIIDRNSHQLLRLIDDILDLSKVEVGKLTIETVEFRLPDLLADLTSIMRFRASEKGIEFRVALATEIPDLICSDPVRLRQILSNIVGNAIKFTSSGFVELRASYQNEQLKFSVKDTGVGLSAKQASQLFRPFIQADSSTTRKFGGTGLGLVISRGLAKAMGGNVELIRTSEAGGSEFEIVVSVKRLDQATLVGAEALVIRPQGPVPVSAEALSGLRVLLVEDSPDNQMLITRYLKKAGSLVTTANDGSEGSQAALTGNFDVVLMDIQMPRMDGHEATRHLRKSGYTKPIVALTAHAMKEEKQRGLQSGFTEFLTKPVQPRLLIELLSQYR